MDALCSPAALLGSLEQSDPITPRLCERPEQTEPDKRIFFKKGGKKKKIKGRGKTKSCIPDFLVCVSEERGREGRVDLHPAGTVAGKGVLIAAAPRAWGTCVFTQGEWSR